MCRFFDLSCKSNIVAEENKAKIPKGMQEYKEREF